MKKILTIVWVASLSLVSFAVWRVYITPKEGGGSWEVRTESGGTGIDALFVYTPKPETLEEFWGVFAGGVSIARYESGMGRGESTWDFDRSIRIAKTAAESAMLSWQIRGESALEIVWSGSESILREGENIVGINGGPASEFLWREAMREAIPESTHGRRGRKPVFTYPVYVIVENSEREQRLHRLEIGSVFDGVTWIADVEIRVRERNGVGESIILPDSKMRGPSAGLAIALGFFNQSTGECLELGGSVAATGHITENGDVLSIGGVKEKTEAAIAAGNDLLLVPEGNLRDAVAQAGDRLRVHSVSSLSDAVSVLAKNPRVKKCLERVRLRESLEESLSHVGDTYKTAG